jgi:hypothetical protein
MQVNIHTFVYISPSSYQNWKCLRKIVEKIKTHMYVQSLIFENLAVYETMWKNTRTV